MNTKREARGTGFVDAQYERAPLLETHPTPPPRRHDREHEREMSGRIVLARVGLTREQVLKLAGGAR